MYIVPTTSAVNLQATVYNNIQMSLYLYFNIVFGFCMFYMNRK